MGSPDAYTALAEIVGCYLPWLWLRQDKPAWLLLPAALSLGLFAWLLTLHDTAAGRESSANVRKGAKNGARTRAKRQQLRHLKTISPVALTNPSYSGHPKPIDTVRWQLF